MNSAFQKVVLRQARLDKLDKSYKELWDHANTVVTEIGVKYELPSDLVMFDIGANIGTVTDAMLRRYPRATIHAFEAVPAYAKYIQVNRGYCVAAREKDPKCGLIHRGKTHVNGFALSDRQEVLEFWLDLDNIGSNTILGNAAGKDENNMVPITAHANTFDWYVQQKGIQRIDVIKMDVEGSEYKALVGMHDTLERLYRARRLPLLQMEIAWGPDKHPHWAEEEAQVLWLFNHGYQRMRYKYDRTEDLQFTPKKEFTHLKLEMPPDLIRT